MLNLDEGKGSEEGFGAKRSKCTAEPLGAL